MKKKIKKKSTSLSENQSIMINDRADTGELYFLVEAKNVGFQSLML